MESPRTYPGRNKGGSKTHQRNGHFCIRASHARSEFLIQPPSGLGSDPCISLFTQLFTGEVPFYYISQDDSVAVKVMRGGLPERPEDKETAARGFNDEMWALMEECWAMDPKARPTASGILSRLQVGSAVRPAIEVKDDGLDGGDGASSERGSLRLTKRVKLEVKDEESDGGGGTSYEGGSSRPTNRIKSK